MLSVNWWDGRGKMKQTPPRFVQLLTIYEVGYGARLRFTLTLTFLVPQGAWVRIPLPCKLASYDRSYFLLIQISTLSPFKIFFAVIIVSHTDVLLP